MTLATLHHLACTGGTVITKCLAAMDGAYVVSEVHPYVITPIHFEPMAPGLQFQAQYGRLTGGELNRLFLAQLSVLERRAKRDDKILVLRDHSHSDFTVPFPDGTRAAVLSDLLSQRIGGRRPPRAATLRDPVETYLSLVGLGWHLGLSFDAYCEGWLAFAETYAETPIFHYEDFCEDPADVTRALCEVLGIRFEADFLERVGQRMLTGDSGRSASLIEPRPWRRLPGYLMDEAAGSPFYSRILDLWPRYRRALEPLQDNGAMPQPRGRLIKPYTPSQGAGLNWPQEAKMNETTPRLGLPLIAAGQAQKHVTHNEALMALDSLVRGTVRSRSLTVEPSLAQDGDAYILPTGHAGPSWSLMPQGDLAIVRDGAWTRVSPPEGTVLFVMDEGLQVARTTDGWTTVASPPWGGGRNRLVNGGMDLWTRGVATEVIGPGWAFQADRWRAYASEGWSCGYARAPVALGPGAPPARYAAQLDIVPGAESEGFVQLYQSLEGVSVFAGEKVTVSAFARASEPAEIDFHLWRNFGVGGSSSYAILGETLTVTSDWRRLACTLEVPILEGATIGDHDALEVILRIRATNPSQVEVTCVQAEAGSFATPFEARPAALEAVMARRYFRRSATALSPSDLAYEMRITPTESGEGPYDYEAEL